MLGSMNKWFARGGGVAFEWRLMDTFEGVFDGR